MIDDKTVSVSIAPPLDPTTLEEWQNAVDAAQALSALNSARLYGLTTGGPKIDVERCDEILERGLRLGVRPRPDAVERFVEGWNLPDAAEEE